MNTITWWPAVAIVGGAGGLVLAAAQLLRRIDPRIDDRLTHFAKGRVTPDDDLEEPAGAASSWMARLAEAYLPTVGGSSTALRQRLLHAGYDAPTGLSVFVATQFLLTLLLAAIGAWMGRLAGSTHLDWLLAAGMGAGIGFLAPGWHLQRRKAVRLRSLNRSLPDFLDLLVTCLEAGLSLEGVLQRISQELGFAHPLLAAEIVRVQREIELGSTADRALQNFADRTDCEAVQSLSTICLQARKYGTRISAALRAHADALREQREQAAEAAAQQAAVKILFPTLVCLFPVVFVVLAGPAAIQIFENLTHHRGAAVSSP